MIFHLHFYPMPHLQAQKPHRLLILSPLSASPSSNLVPIHFSSRILMPERPAMGSMGTEAIRGTQQKWPFSSELRAVFGTEVLPKDQSFTDFEFPPWNEHKTSEITLGIRGIREWVKRVQIGGGMPQGSMSCRFVRLARLQFYSEHH